MKLIKKLYKQIIHTAPQKNYFADALVTIPRVITGLLLTIDFGSSKFGMPWSPAEKNLDLFEVSYTI